MKNIWNNFGEYSKKYEKYLKGFFLIGLILFWRIFYLRNQYNKGQLNINDEKLDMVITETSIQEYKQRRRRFENDLFLYVSPLPKNMPL